MSSEEARLRSAAVLRELNDAFARADPDDAVLDEVAQRAREQIAALDAAPRRDRMALMRAAGGGFPDSTSSGFADRAVAGLTNPTSVAIAVRFEGNEVVAD